MTGKLFSIHCSHAIQIFYGDVINHTTQNLFVERYGKIRELEREFLTTKIRVFEFKNGVWKE